MTRCKGVGVFGSALLRREGVRGFGFGIGCSEVIQMTQDGRRQVGIGRIGVGMVTVVTDCRKGVKERATKERAMKKKVTKERVTKKAGERW